VQFVSLAAVQGRLRNWRPEPRSLNHRHDITGKICGVGIARQISFRLRALESQAHHLLSRVSTRNEIVSNTFIAASRAFPVSKDRGRPSARFVFFSFIADWLLLLYLSVNNY
jgi:hypothetical protein